MAYEEMGDSDGVPLIVLHGTPGSWRQLAVLAAPARERGWRVVTPNRAGYGGSDRDPNRTIASSARDVGALMHHLGLPRCAIVGISGGGPTALGCAALFGDRVSAVTTVGSIAPLVPRDSSLPTDRLLTRLARRSESSTRVVFALMTRGSQSNPERLLERLAAMSAAPDARLLREDSATREAFLDDLRHSTPDTARAAARDFWLFTRAWDVDLAQIRIPVDVWHGTADRNVPVAHAHVIAARCPTATLHIIDGGGHMLLGELDEIIATLSSRQPPD
jgi:pimeloyl-ACP methyl ester carboxylesterase